MKGVDENEFTKKRTKLLQNKSLTKKEKIELKERNSKDTIKTVPLPKLVKILDEWVKNHPKDMEILGR